MQYHIVPKAVHIVQPCDKDGLLSNYIMYAPCLLSPTLSTKVYRKPTTEISICTETATTTFLQL